MRELKFRAWQVDGGIMLPNIQNHIGPETGFGVLLRDEGYVVMQYTGLKDKNGKEIYEGDVVKLGDNPIHDGVLVGCLFSQKRAMWTYVFLTGDNKGKATGMVDSWRSYEVIGNIYENKELLETI